MSVLNPYGLVCGALLVLIDVNCSYLFLIFKIADQEISRKGQIESKLDYLSRKLGELDIMKQLPDDDFDSHTLVNRSVDVVSAIMCYVALQIHHEAVHFGLIGGSAKSKHN